MSWRQLHPEIPGDRTRVLRVIARLNVGGPARHATLLDAGLRKREFETLLVHGSVGSGEASMEHLLIDCSLPAVKIPELGRRIAAMDDIRAFVRLLRVMFAYRPDIIHTHTAKAGALGRICAVLYNLTRRRGKRAFVVHTFHGHVFSGYFGRAGTLAARWIERLLALASDCIIAISRSQKHDLVNRFRIAASAKVAMVPLGLDLAPLLTLTRDPAARETFGYSADQFVIGYVGRFVPVKNLDMLLRVFTGVAAQLPAARFMFSGDGELRPAMEASAASLGLQDRVSFVGWQWDLKRLYGALDVIALSSHNEGTPVALIEAMAAGLPVVATAVGAVPEVVEHGVTGFIVPPGDTEKMVRFLVELGRNPNRRVEMGRHGRQLVRDQFDVDRLLEDVASLYRGGLAAVRPSGVTMTASGANHF